MNTDDFVLLSYLALGKSIKGKTTLQKDMYFIGILSNRIDELGYRPHYYGPYSPFIAHANEELKTYGYVMENTSVWGIDTNGFEVVRYDYALTETGEKVAKEMKEINPAEWDSIHDAAKKILSAGEIDYMSLSVAAKSYFILKRQGDKTTVKDIKTIAKDFGWDVKDDKLDKALDFLEKTELAVRN